MVSPTNFADRVAIAMGLDTSGLIPSKEQVDAKQEQQGRKDDMHNMMNTPVAGQIAKGAMENPEVQKMLSQAISPEEGA